jgi:predicted NUDIX family NTP pyrophosphohydrolase
MLEVLLAHPGGPFWKNKDAGAWSIPKGEFALEEDALAAARREFFEEMGFALEGEVIALAPVRQRGGKTVYAFAIEADLDASTVKSNTFSIEWPPRSGTLREFPEIDRAAWFTVEIALQKINAGQAPLLLQLQQLVTGR